VRSPDGWHIRDCSGRATRVNGKSIQDEPLNNGDTIQIGTFSFEAQLPPIQPALPAGADAGRIERLQLSRRRLVELAVGLRRKMREQTSESAHLVHQQADLERIERRLRKMHDDQQARQAQLAEEKNALDRRAQELDAYARHLRREVESLGQKSAETVHQFEADLSRQRIELKAESERLSQWQGELSKRQAELEAMAEELSQHLVRDRQQLDRDRELVAQEREILTQERANLDRLREQVVQQTPTVVSSRETQFDGTIAGLESARRLLRELAERRKSAQGTSPSRTNVPRPPR
jgi:chromosome segregation ATPase